MVIILFPGEYYCLFFSVTKNAFSEEEEHRTSDVKWYHS